MRFGKEFNLPVKKDNLLMAGNGWFPEVSRMSSWCTSLRMRYSLRWKSSMVGVYESSNLLLRNLKQQRQDTSFSHRPSENKYLHIKNRSRKLKSSAFQQEDSSLHVCDVVSTGEVPNFDTLLCLHQQDQAVLSSPYS
jgi:hypothetical protein